MQSNRIVIIGGGASIRQGQWDKTVSELSLWNILKNEATISLNYVFRYIEPTIATFVDETFYRSNLKELKNIPLIIGSYARNVENVIMPNTYLIKSLSSYVDNQWEKGFYGSNLCGIFALSMAINLGFTEIFLLGYDFGTIEKYTHFYQDEVNLKEKDCNGQPKYRGMGFRENGKGQQVYKTTNYSNNPNQYFKEFERFKDTSITLVGNSNISTFPCIDYKKFYNYLNTYPQPVIQSYLRDEIETTFLTKIKK